MLDKGKGPKLGKLRVIQLIEADLNFVLRLLWGYRLNRSISRQGLYDTSQFAVPGKTCTSAAFNKVLFLDLTRQLKVESSMTDKDASAAFDRVLPALAIVTCERLGLPPSAGRFLYNLLTNMIFRVGTGHGVSTKTYAANEDPARPGQGSGQGTGSAPIIYGTTAEVTLAAYRKHGVGAAFCHPSGSEPSQTDHITEYVDDSTAMVNRFGMDTKYGGEAAATLQEEADADSRNGTAISGLTAGC